MKKKNKIVMIVLLFLIVIVCSGVGGYFLIINKEEKQEVRKPHPAIYEACDEDSCIYLLGTMHLADSKLDGLTPEIWDVYNKSDAIAFELDITSLPVDAGTDAVMLEDGDDLSNYLTEEEFQKLENFLKKWMISIDTVREFNLAGVASLIEQIAYLELQLQPDYGVDQQLLEKSHADKKEIIELETYEFQLSLLYGFKDEYYVEQINSLIDNYAYSKGSTKLLYDCYASGNTWLLKELLSAEDKEEDEFVQKMLIDRNINMANQAEEFLKENKKVTIAVGAAHVVGEKGLVDLLTERGYKVSLIK